MARETRSPGGGGEEKLKIKSEFTAHILPGLLVAKENQLPSFLK
jgi:hypothetical protein